MWIGILGSAAANLAFVTSFVSMVAMFMAQRRDENYKSWFNIGKWGVILHAVSVTTVIASILGLVLAKQYQYHYVFTHSSNELPIHFVISCLWEGQEGSFLLWMFWHSILALPVLAYAKEWRPGVLAVMSSVELILTSMVLGVYFNETVVYALLTLTMVGLTAALFMKNKEETTQNPFYLNVIRTAAPMLVLISLVNLVQKQTGYWHGSVFNLPFTLEILYLLVFIGITIFAYTKSKINFSQFAPALALSALAVVFGLAEVGVWKVGSSPFILLREARPDNIQFQLNPDFIPSNGNGLNPLLQNYWMVIHPPTLFLGFAATLIPFAFVITGLIERKYSEWIRPASPWTIFSVMILGVGIIMGGYWAYETLNFGGYWNWDPVENASLVPWLVGVASLHGMLSYRKGKANLTLSMLLVISTFILVLYSTFLTRSGVLGDASVHSFTDLGLSGQLLVLLFVYLFFVSLLLVWRWNEIPGDPKTETLWTREFFLFLAALILIFASVEITLWTSMPVINKIFGTNKVIKGSVPFFYYKWNVWFGIAVAALSAIGQFFFWTKIEKKELSKAIFKPFAVAIFLAITVMILLVVFKKTFVYNQRYLEGLQQAKAAGGLDAILSYLEYGILTVADELLLVAALFTIAANINIIYRLTSRNLKNLKTTGGSLAHIGFGLMLVGVLFSSGYEEILSINNDTQQMAENLTEEKKRDNVLLEKNKTKTIKNYQVTYRGKVEAEAPISGLRILEEDVDFAKVGFVDKKGERFYLYFPSEHFLTDSKIVPTSNGQTKKENEYNFEKLKFFIENQLEISRPSMMNNRMVYQIEFKSQKDTSHKFYLYPEAEQSGNAELISHPDRNISLNKDLYVHVFGIPKTEEKEWTVINNQAKISLGDTLSVEDKVVLLEKVEQITPPPSFRPTDLLVRLHLKVTAPDRKYYYAYPIYIIDHTNKAMSIESKIDALDLRFAFIGALPKENKVALQVLKHTNKQDYIILNAISKPWINFLWLGTFVMTAGFLMAIYRRVKERN